MSILNVGGTEAWMANTIQIGGQKTLDQLIKSLFADGTQGLYLNAQDAVSVSDLSSIKDLSGRNNHAAQPNATSRATLITDPSGYKSLKFDGVDDGYVTQSINFTNTDKVTVIAALSKNVNIISMLCELSANVNTNVGTFYLTAPENNTGNYGFKARGSATSAAQMTVLSNATSASDKCVVVATGNIPADKNTIKISGIESSVTYELGTGSYGNHPMYIGRRGGTSLPFNGQIYALLVIGKLLDAATTAKIEKEFAKYIGVTL